MASGAVLGAYGLTEPGAGSDAGGTRTTARLEDGDAGSSTARSGSSPTPVTPARTSSRHGPARPTRATPRSARSSSPPTRPGFSVGRLEDKLGLHASATGELRFEARASPPRTCSASEGDGFRTFLKILDGGRISIGALAVGLAQAALDAAIPYAQTREQFGRPIGTFQGVAFMVADMATEIEAARSLVWKAAWLKDQGRDYGLVAAEAKLFASEVSSRATNAAIQIHGGYGYVDRLPGRALPARREADRDRGGDQPGPAARDRPEDPRAAGRLRRSSEGGPISRPATSGGRSAGTGCGRRRRSGASGSGATGRRRPRRLRPAS